MRRLQYSNFKLVKVHNILDYDIVADTPRFVFVNQQCPESAKYIVEHPDENYVYYEDCPLIFFHFKITTIPTVMSKLK